MHHSVADVGRTDTPLLRLVDPKAPVGTRAIAIAEELSFQLQQFGFEVEVECGHRMPIFFALNGFVRRGQQIVKADDLFKQVADAFHDASCCLSQPPTMRPASSRERMANSYCRCGRAWRS